MKYTVYTKVKLGIYDKQDKRRGTADDFEAAARFCYGLEYGSSVKYRNKTLFVCDWIDGDIWPCDWTTRGSAIEIKNNLNHHIYGEYDPAGDEEYQKPPEEEE